MMLHIGACWPTSGTGRADLPRALKLEWRFVAVRWLGIAFVTPAVLLANLGTDRLLAAYAVIAVAAFTTARSCS